MPVLGLTGSVGMGKSATARLFAEQGCAIYDADLAVHKLYAGEVSGLIEEAFPGSTRDGVVDRAALSRQVLGDRAALARLEGIVHPLVRQAEHAFLADAASRNIRTVVLDIPLLFERERTRDVDAIVVVSAPEAVQRERVLARPGMTEEKFAHILARQMPDSEKRARAHFLVDTGRGHEDARRAVLGILRALAAHPGRRRES
jgi:dephospho-CoA kinase